MGIKVLSGTGLLRCGIIYLRGPVATDSPELADIVADYQELFDGDTDLEIVSDRHGTPLGLNIGHLLWVEIRKARDAVQGL